MQVSLVFTLDSNEVFVVANLDVVAQDITWNGCFNFPEGLVSPHLVAVEIIDPINHYGFVSGSHDHLTLPFVVVVCGEIISICVADKRGHIEPFNEIECLSIEKGHLGDSAVSA
jgi:hypothetical protein